MNAQKVFYPLCDELQFEPDAPFMRPDEPSYDRVKVSVTSGRPGKRYAMSQEKRLFKFF